MPATTNLPSPALVAAYNAAAVTLSAASDAVRAAERALNDARSAHAKADEALAAIAAMIREGGQ